MAGAVCDSIIHAFIMGIYILYLGFMSVSIIMSMLLKSPYYVFLTHTELSRYSRRTIHTCSIYKCTCIYDIQVCNTHYTGSTNMI